MIGDLSEQILAAVHREFVYLRNFRTTAPRGPVRRSVALAVSEVKALEPLMSDGLIRRALRVEIAQAWEDAFMCGLFSDITTRDLVRDRDGPFTYQGIAWYFVERLPAPGWRVVNPFRP